MLKPKRKTYGNTTWGNAWIQALEALDTNRLARGKTYANTGRVLHVGISQGTVSARVKGSYHSTYQVEIKSALFTQDEIQTIGSLIGHYPSLSIELSTGKLPPHFLNMLEQAGINLLPREWADLKARCPCPDDENPCKHLAAVYYLLTNEIDKDPFILFHLKGLSTEMLLEPLKGMYDSDVSTVVFQGNPLLSRFSKSLSASVDAKALKVSDFQFVFPQNDMRPLLALLPDNPPFYAEGDFKTFLEMIYRTVPLVSEKRYSDGDDGSAIGLSGKTFQLEFFKDVYSSCHVFQWKILTPSAKPAEKDSIAEVFQESRFQKRFLNEPGQAQVKFHKDNALITQEVEGGNLQTARRWAIAVTPGSAVFDYFLNAALPVDFSQASSQASYSFVFLKIIAALSQGLVKAHLFLPELVLESENDFTIRYVPNTQEQGVQILIEKLQTLMPPDICHTGERFLQPEGVTDLVSLFLTHLVHQAFKSQIMAKKDKLLKTFTQPVLFQAKQFSEKNMVSSIANWLERLHVGKRDIAPQIRFETAEDDGFTIYVDVINRKEMLNNILPFKALFAQNRKIIFERPKEAVQLDVSRQLIIAAQYMDELRLIVDSQGSIAPTVTLAQMSDILVHTAGILEVLGIGLILPRELKDLAYPQLQARAKLRKTSETGASYLSLAGMLDFSYEIALGEESITPKQFETLVQQSGGLVKFKDQYVLLKPDAIQQILQKLKAPLPALESPMQALYTAFTGKINGLSFEPDEALKRVLSDLMRVKTLPIPKNLNATLRPYQERGFQWLGSNAQNGFGSCIADDMGLGKTIQVLTVLLHTKNNTENPKPSLVICPTTLIGNWEKESQKFAPDLRLSIYHGSERQLQLKHVDLVLTSFGTFRRDFKKFSAQQWQFLIVDEAQNIKNSNTAQTQTIKALIAESRIAMTGTPVENRLTELWNIFDFINPGYLGAISQFKTQLANPIEKYQDRETVGILKKATSPFILRRLKTDKTIISDLPDKVSFNEYCYLTQEQAAVYQSVVESTLKAIEETEGIQRKGLIFRLITRLKQICNHPAHFASQGSFASILSGKSAKTIAILEAILENREKALIFTQYREMGHLLQQMIQAELRTEPLFFHGGIPRKKRDSMVQTFQTESDTPLMIISLKAGGTGLNLTEASNVIHYDLWWNPAVENQATDRAYRIGQEKKVLVHRLVTLGTFEEKIDEMIQSKKALADLTVSNGERWITEMSNRDLREIFSLFKKPSSP